MTRSTKPRVVHSLLCNSSEAVIVETIEIAPTGQARHVLRCESCGRTSNRKDQP